MMKYCRALSAPAPLAAIAVGHHSAPLLTNVVSGWNWYSVAEQLARLGVVLRGPEWSFVVLPAPYQGEHPEKVLPRSTHKLPTRGRVHRD
jgi:hypothetical protein